jgi:hypothetical protein
MLIFCTNNPILFSFMTYEWVCINRNKQMIMVICSEFCKTNLVLSPFITYHRICDKRNTTDATCVWSRNCLLLIVYRNCLSFWSTWVHPTCVGFLLLNLAFCVLLWYYVDCVQRRNLDNREIKSRLR